MNNALISLMMFSSLVVPSFGREANLMTPRRAAEVGSGSRCYWCLYLQTLSSQEII